MSKSSIKTPAMVKVHIWPIPLGCASGNMEGSKTGSDGIGAYNVSQTGGHSGAAVFRLCFVDNHCADQQPEGLLDWQNLSLSAMSFSEASGSPDGTSSVIAKSSKIGHITVRLTEELLPSFSRELPSLGGLVSLHEFHFVSRNPVKVSIEVLTLGLHANDVYGTYRLSCSMEIKELCISQLKAWIIPAED
ncbi:hypothetical protein Trihar35433_1714 [Trichoderma harzianum]|nr:hypothetical protein Trihar35433_1714 [Trichoderma harzianum]